MLILSGTSGAGKTALKNMLMDKYNIKEVISVTTRKPRLGEIDGVDYKFISRERFTALINTNAFFEYQTYLGHLYGKLLTDVVACKDGKIISVLGLDGALKLKRQYGDKLILVFIGPPSIEELRNRMTQRGDNEEEIEERMQEAHKEILRSSECDFIVTNSDVNKAFAELEEIFLQLN